MFARCSTTLWDMSLMQQHQFCILHAEWRPKCCSGSSRSQKQQAQWQQQCRTQTHSRRGHRQRQQHQTPAQTAQQALETSWGHTVAIRTKGISSATAVRWPPKTASQPTALQLPPGKRLQWHQPQQHSRRQQAEVQLLQGVVAAEVQQTMQRKSWTMAHDWLQDTCSKNWNEACRPLHGRWHAEATT
jgi:hypothetical protein